MMDSTTDVYICVLFFIYHSVAHTHRVNQAINKLVFCFFSIINKPFEILLPKFLVLFTVQKQAQNILWIFFLVFIVSQ